MIDKENEYDQSDEEIPLKEDNELVLLLHKKYNIKSHRGGGYGTVPEYRYFDAEEIEEVQYEVEEGDEIDGVPIKVLNQGSDYSEVDPGVNPMSVVFEFQFPGGSRYLLVSGYYVSHDGGYWDDYREVKQKPKTVITYE